MNSRGIVDQSGRIIDYIRVSITQKCNLRCVYCMPENCKIEEERLDFEDYLKILRVFRELGVKKVKITGGEPLVRKGINEFVNSLKNDIGFESVTLTTNGILLSENIDSLLGAGIDGINISLDTMDRQKYREITRFGEFNSVKNAIDKLLDKGFKNVKINMVPIYGINSDEIIDFVDFAHNNPVAVRFIELMPISEAVNYKGIKREKIISKIRAKYGEEKLLNEKLGNGPAEYYTFKNFNGKIGFIDAVGHRFCENCNRVRMDSSGNLRLCLEYGDGISMLDFLQGKISKDEFKEKLRKIIYKKPIANDFDVNSVRDFNMNNIGG